MKNRLYYADSYQTEFTASIVERTTVNGKSALILDQTCFYPTSGGQAYDTGWIDEHRVVDVMTTPAGAVVHVLESEDAALGVGQTVRGTIDWARRYDHMQQHSGQHLLSYLCDKLFGYETVSVHFGATESTLDLAAPSLSPAQCATIEQHAAEIIYANVPIQAYFVNGEQLAQLPLRRPPKVDEDIRIVEIAGMDYVACGGTHCRRTGELGPLKLLRQERSRGNSRITFKCGWRALDDYRTKHDLVTGVAGLFSTDIAAVPDLVERMLEQNKELQHRMDTLAEQLLQYEAQAMLQTAESVAGYPLLVGVCAEKEVEAVKKLAAILQAQARAVILLGAVAEGQLTVFFARGHEVPLHMGNVLRETLREFGGGGGGRPEFAQGGGVADSLAADLFTCAVERIRTVLAAAQPT